MARSWFVYLLECRDGSYYCGVTTDVERRVAQHNAGRGAKYTRGRTPVSLCCSLPVDSKSDALKLEAKIKRLRRAQKQDLIARLKEKR